MSKPPVARIEEVTTTLHGQTLVDPYAWLKDTTRKDPEMLAHLGAENDFCKQSMAHLEEFQKELFDEMLGRIQEDDSSVPSRKGNFWYYSRTVVGKQYSIWCRKEGSLDADEQVLLDENALADGHDFFKLGAFAVSPDHSLLAYATDTDGSERFVLRFRDLATGQDLPDVIDNLKPSIEWANDNQTLFYVVSDEADRPYRLFRHLLGTEKSQDVLVHDESDERFYLSIDKTRDERFLLLELGSSVTSEVSVLDAGDPTGSFRVIHPRQQDMEYDVAHHGGHFYIRTNDQAVNFKLVRTPTDNPGKANWQEVIPHRPAVYLTGVRAFADHLVISERDNGLQQLRIRKLSTGDEHYIEFPEPTYSVSGGSNPEFDTTTFRFGYTSPKSPPSVFDYELETRERTLRKEQPVLGGYDKSNYTVERVWATADDGTKVPISLVYRNDLPKDGSRPFWLTGYGSYGMSYPARFSSTRISLLDRGFAVGVAHIRGGGDMGRQWYENGKYLNKKNTFSDFIAAADHLCGESGFTSHDKLVISGGSAGGLLMGAVLNARPDVCRVAVANVPFVDLINTMLDETLPLTVVEWEEWGNPKDDKYFDYMLSYSPYDNVRAADYPAMLITGGLNDPRVGYWEPAKWVAKLRAQKTSDTPLLLKTEMGAGHGGKSGRYGVLEDVALEFAFALDVLGLVK